LVTFLVVHLLSDRPPVINVWCREQECSIALKKFNITEFAGLEHKKTHVLLQCTDIDIMMYRNGTSHVPK